jgi:serine O-acetyltransferase
MQSSGQPGLLALIRSDLSAKAEWLYGSASRRNVLKTCATDGTFAMFVYRLMQCSQRARLAPLSMVFNKVNGLLGGCVIGRNAQFGPRFVLVHSDGIVINTSVVAGCNVFLEHQVTIGAERGTSPRFGDNVFVGAGAKIIGGVSIGSDVRIGANAVVVADLPDGVTAVGIPAKIVRRRTADPAELVTS